MKPDPALLERLSALRFVADVAKPSVGIGERRSSAQGAGLEFSSYRPYREGDDLRHLDLRVRARLGENYVRQYSVDRQLSIAIILDASASMVHGVPDKFECAKGVAQLLGFVGLAAGDLVRIGASGAGPLSWSPAFQGLARAELLFDWVSDQTASGSGAFEKTMETFGPGLPAGSLVILISDWWTGDISRGLSLLASQRHEVLAIHVQSPDEIDPELLTVGTTRMTDLESGEEFDLAIDAGTVARYQAAYAEWTERLQARFARWHGRYVRLNTRDDLSDFLLRRLRVAGALA